jgi:alpha-galactosidase
VLRRTNILLLALAPALVAADLSGTWQGQTEGERRLEYYCVFRAEGRRFTGQIVTNRDRGEIVNGVIDGNRITFDWKNWADTGRLTAYEGEWNGDQLKISRKIRAKGRPPEVRLRRTSSSREYNPPRSMQATHQPLPLFQAIAPNGLAKTPPMGWNSWNKFGVEVSDKLIREIADAMVTSGMRDAGYLYVNIDDGWEGTRDEHGTLRPNEKFPDMRGLAGYVHSKGLKLGIYSSPGRLTCALYEGSYGHEEQDARTFAEWGIDYLKYDWCSASVVYRPDEMPGVYLKMAHALRKTGRPIVYSLCQYGLLNVGEWGAAAGGNLWRTTGDIADRWDSMSGIGFSQNGREKDAGPGRWNDPDMLEIGNGGMTDEEYQTHMSLWAILAAPLLAGNDIRQMSEATRRILLNREVIAVNQDALGLQGFRVKQQGELEIWKKPLSDGIAVGLFNRSASAARMTVQWAELQVTPQRVRDLWAHQDVARVGVEFSAEVPSHGVVLLRAW